MNRLFFSDIDHTLVEPENGLLTVSPKTAYALKELKKNGDYVFLATGRGKGIMPDDLMDLDISGFIYAGGAYAEMNSKIVFSCPFDEKTLKEVWTYCEGIHAEMYFLANSHMFVKDKDDEQFIKAMKDWGIACNFKNYDHLDEEVYIIEPFFRKEEDIETFKRAFPELHVAQMRVGTGADVTMKGVNKGLATRKVMEYLKIPKENCYAFGDGENDIGMLQEVGWGIAVNNADERLKKVADEITEGVLEDGFYHSLVRHGFIEPGEF